MSGSCLTERTALVIEAVHKAFGAPGDYGYETAQGKALFELYQLGASARNFASKDIDGGAERQLQISLAGALGAADELLNQALLELREQLEVKIECRCFLTYDDDPVSARIAENRSAIEDVADEIELIREIEQHLCRPYSGPIWLDEIIAQGPDWAGEES